MGEFWTGLGEYKEPPAWLGGLLLVALLLLYLVGGFWAMLGAVTGGLLVGTLATAVRVLIEKMS